DEALLGDSREPVALVGVDAGLGVVVVVREVRPDLDEQRADERRQRGQRGEHVHRDGETGADEHRRGGRRQRLWSRGHQPRTTTGDLLCTHVRKIRQPGALTWGYGSETIPTSHHVAFEKA